MRKLGDFTLLEELGRGGMGVVYKALQESMGRIVALKVLPSFAGMDPEAVQRFRREAEAAGRLSHPGIVPVYAVGEAEGMHYFAMELVEGPSLHALLENLKGRVPGRLLGSLAEETSLADAYPGLRDPQGGGFLSSMSGARYARSCAAVMAEVASALAAAHQSKIIHRDLKPSNIMIRKGGRPVILDFGLARDEMNVGLTRSGEAVGTPSYMAPEQAMGKKELDHRVDIYGLGATLYELLTLRPPFEGAHAGEIMRKILDSDPEPVRRINERVPQELETIVEACLQKDPDLRYPAMEALELDLRAFLSGGALSVRRTGLAYRIKSALRRHRRALLVTSLVVAVSTAAVVTVGAVAMHGQRDAGAAALGEARKELLVNHDPAKANEAYGKAAALLGDETVVRNARREHLREAFDSLYAQGHGPMLQAYLSNLPRDANDKEMRTWLARLDGIGKLVLDEGVGADAKVTLRRFDAAQDLLEPEWRPMPANAEVAVGDYLIRIERLGYADEVHRIVVARDAALRVPLCARELREEPDGALLVPRGDGRDPIWVARTEMTNAEYAAILRRVTDRELRESLKPKVPIDRDLDLPVRGVSWRQARTIAALAGAHLMRRDEFLAAGNAGLQRLAFPWGRQLDLARVVADVNKRSKPEPAVSLGESASPHGILHLVGNVAELLAPDAERPACYAGGHWTSEPNALPLVTEPMKLDGPEQQLGTVGMRLARFAAPRDGVALRAEVEAKRKALLESGARSNVADWTIDERGRVLVGLTLQRSVADESGTFRTHFATPGFLQTQGPPSVRNGHGEPLRHAERIARNGQESELTIEGLGAKGQGFRVTIERELLPVDGLRGDRDGYVFELPIHATGLVAVSYRIVLPRGCEIDECDPTPQASYAHDGRWHVVFDYPADGAGERVVPAIVRFRRDGPLGEAPIAPASVAAGMNAIMTALESRTPGRLADAIAPCWVQLPSGIDYQQLERANASQDEHFKDAKLVDATSVGPVVTARILVNWSTQLIDMGVVTEMHWPMQLVMLREGSGWRGLRLSPASRADQGQIVGGAYRHARLQVEWTAPAGEVLVRKLAHDCELQVSCRAASGAHVLVLGEFSDEETDAVLLHLSAGESKLRPGGHEPGPEFEFVGSGESHKNATTSDWLFGATGDHAWSRERWYVMHEGRRWLLVKAVASGATPAEAKEAFKKNEPWFKLALENLIIR